MNSEHVLIYLIDWDKNVFFNFDGIKTNYFNFRTQYQIRLSNNRNCLADITHKRNLKIHTSELICLF